MIKNKLEQRCDNVQYFRNTLRIKHRTNVSTIRMLSFRQEFNDTRIKFGVDESSTTVGNFLQVLTLWFPDRYN